MYQCKICIVIIRLSGESTRIAAIYRLMKKKYCLQWRLNESPHSIVTTRPFMLQKKKFKYKLFFVSGNGRVVTIAPHLENCYFYKNFIMNGFNTTYVY